MDDSRGVQILPTDTVTVTSYGEGARLVDCGLRSKVVRFGRTKVVIIDADGRERAVSPSNLLVARRDGYPGHEYNTSFLQDWM